MLRKIFGLLIFPILGASVHTYAQEEYDQQIFQYINQEKWFDAKSLYDTRHDDLSEVIRLISGAFLGAYFNRPAEGVAAVEAPGPSSPLWARIRIPASGSWR